MFKFAAFVPHPPIILPKIGEKNTKYAQKTVEGIKKLSLNLESADIDTIVFISPHTTLDPESMTISYSENARGSFAQFDHPEIFFENKIDLKLADLIIQESLTEEIPLRPQNYEPVFTLDHGTMVPYYFLEQDISTGVKIIVIGFSALSRDVHMKFGNMLSKTISNYDQNVAIIASGDLSHRILDLGSEFVGQKFDNMIVDAIAANNTMDILKIDEYLQEEAGECGYRSLLILLGALEGHLTKPEILSYEAPFGVGYMVANFNI